MSDTLFARFDGLITWSSGDQRAPHKPLLILLALGAWERGQTSLKFSDTADPLTDLLKRFGPDRKAYHPEAPFWRLQNDGVWQVTGTHPIALGKDGAATKGSLRAAEAKGQFPEDIQAQFRLHPEWVRELAQRLLDAHFPTSLHEDILDAVGLELKSPRASGGGRDPNFRKRVLTAYQHQCAVCGLQLLLSGSSIALEAAHIRWHQASGPATVRNGLCLCVLHHKLFDLGAITVSAKLSIMISDLITGLCGFNEALLAHHGKPLRLPLREEDIPDPKFIEWHHREVFRGEPRPAGG